MNHRIQVREQVQRIVKVAQTVQGFGSVVTQIDLTHAGLPWAAVSLLLTMSQLSCISSGLAHHELFVSSQLALHFSANTIERILTMDTKLTVQAILSGSKQSDLVLSGIEEINNLIARYTVTEGASSPIDITRNLVTKLAWSPKQLCWAPCVKEVYNERVKIEFREAESLLWTNAWS